MMTSKIPYAVVKKKILMSYFCGRVPLSADSGENLKPEIFNKLKV